MMNVLAKKLFGTQNDRELKSIYPLVEKIRLFENSLKSLSNSELQAKTPHFRERLSRGEALDALLPEAFAVVREASTRILGQRHYDVQMIGGITLHRGRIAEMKTGEGKTLTATAPMYLNALAGKGAHLVTVNDYLARRDAGHMGQLYGFLGLSTGIIVHGLTDRERKQSYGSDITYGTNNEFGFDYLRDNMKFRIEDYVQRELHYAIVDEVDSILIDEARTPLIISGPTDDSSELYVEIDRKLRQDGGLQKDLDYSIDEKGKSASLTEAGVEKMEKRLGIQNLYDPANIEILHHVTQALRAHVIYKRDVEYVLRDGEVVIVDEFTGRLMPGRRWSDGLHQAIEAKEGVTIENENQTLATITFQNYFRMYQKLSGMTGTADTEAKEFKQIYNLDVTVIPTNKAMIRKDHGDLIFKNQLAKFRAVAKEIRELHEKGQPVLVGTVSVEKSELLHELLKREGIPHSVLNAKQHEREAYVVAQAGRKGAVTISTNMAGRGTDILLGGAPELLAKQELGASPPADAPPEELQKYQERAAELEKRWRAQCEKEKAEVLAAGGLFILGTERHESRRIDNQLRGRSGRQGDPGASRFYLSFEDDLLRIFGQGALLQKTVEAMEEDVPIEHAWTTKAIENAQKKVEGHHFDIRKHLLEYDDVMNRQRKVIYAWRRDVLAKSDLEGMMRSILDELCTAVVDQIFPNGRLKRGASGQPSLDIEELNRAVLTHFQIPAHLTESEIDPLTPTGLRRVLDRVVLGAYEERKREFGAEIMAQIQKMILLTTIDTLWKDHLLAMDHLREGIGLQGYGQKDPLIAYKKEAFRYFQMMMNQISMDAARKLFSVQLAPEKTVANLESEFEEAESRAQPRSQNMQYNLASDGRLIPSVGEVGASAEEKQPFGLSTQSSGRTSRGNLRPMSGPFSQTSPRVNSPAVERVGRNDPCPCGSGKKYKKCHGLLE
jgi:preprotein translocase subunit SecA